MKNDYLKNDDITITRNTLTTKQKVAVSQDLTVTETLIPGNENSDPILELLYLMYLEKQAAAVQKVTYKEAI